MTVDTMESLLKPNILYPLIFGGAIITSVLVKGIVACVTSISRERSRREIAAYIAEGSITSDQGERLLKADPRKTVC